MDDLLSQLALTIKRWLSAGKSRTLYTLSRRTGVPYATLRRAYNKEGIPQPTTCLDILDVTAPDEMYDFFEKMGEHTICKHLLSNLGNSTARLNEEITSKLTTRDAFICLALAYTIGASSTDVERICGELGLSTFESLVEQGILVASKDPYVFVPNSESDMLVVLNKKIAGNISQFIAEIAPTDPGSQNLFMTYNVTRNDYEAILDIFRDAHARALEIARESKGSIPMLQSIVTSKLINKEASE